MTKFNKDLPAHLQVKTIMQNFDKKQAECDALKKENEELMVLIQSSKYKNIISTENENKKLKLQVSQYETELSNEKKIREEHEKRLTDNQLQMEKMKKIIEKKIIIGAEYSAYYATHKEEICYLVDSRSNKQVSIP